MSISPVPPSFGSDGGDQAATVIEPKPPALHWALLLLINLVTASIFAIIWSFVQANFARKIDSDSKATLWYEWVLGIVGGLSAMRLIFGSATFGQKGGLFYGLMFIASFLFYQMGNFSIKRSLELYYGSTGRMERRLSGRMMVFFGQVYLQYHFNRIAKRQRAAPNAADVLSRSSLPSPPPG
jgi:hypothetical protein